MFPDGVPLPLSRIEQALERAGLVTRHVEGLPHDYAETLRYWIESYEARYEDAVRLAGVERARVWRVYLRAARQGFLTGWASVYQVLATPSDADADAARDRGGLDDRGRRLAVGRQLVDQLLEVQYVANVRLDQEAVVARDPVALDDLGQPRSQLDDLV